MNTIPKDFEDFLKTIHAENESDGVLDDDLADNFDDWISNDLMGDEIFAYADKYAHIKYLQGKNEGMDRALEIFRQKGILADVACKTCDGTKKVTYNMGHDDEYTTDCPDCVAHSKAETDTDDDSADLPVDIN